MLPEAQSLAQKVGNALVATTSNLTSSLNFYVGLHISYRYLHGMTVISYKLEMF